MASWSLFTFTGTSGLKKVGFQDENQGDHFYEVRSITEAHGDPKAVVLRFHSASQSGKTPPSKLVVNLDNFLAPPDTEWVVLEDAEDAATFIDTYIKIRQELRKVDEEEDVVGSDADLFEFKTNSPDNSGSGREKEDLEENMEEEERDGGALGQDALEDEGHQTLRHVLNSCPVALRDTRYTWRHNSVLKELVTTLQQWYSKSGQQVVIRCDLSRESSEVGTHTTIPPDVLPTSLVPDITIQDPLHKVSSNMATYVTVATLSPRCYQEALDIMSKWSSGECRGQGKSLKVTQTIFKELNGMGKELEDDIYSLLHRLNHGEIEKEEFDTEAKAKKKNCASRSKSKPSKEVTDGEVQELKKEKEKTEGELRDLKKEKERTEEELSDLRKEKEKIEEDVRELKKEKEKTEQELSDLKKEKEKAEGKDDQKIVASLRAEIASVQAEKRELEKKVEDLLEENKKLKVLLESKLESTAEANLKRRPSEEEQPVSKRSKTVSNWEGKAIEPGQLVAVAFSAPRRFHIGKVLEVDIEKQYSVHVQFYKPARKILENYGEPEWTKPQFVLDTSVDVPKTGSPSCLSPKVSRADLRRRPSSFGLWKANKYAFHLANKIPLNFSQQKSHQDLPWLLLEVQLAIPNFRRWMVLEICNGSLREERIKLLALEAMPARRSRVRDDSKKPRHRSPPPLPGNREAITMAWTTDCGCGDDCCGKLGNEAIRACREKFWSYPQDKQREFIRGALEAADRRKDNGPYEFSIQGSKICARGWCLAFGVKKSRFYEMRAAYEKGEMVVPDLRNGMKFHSRRYLEAKEWLTEYAKKYGDIMPNSNNTHLPQCLQKIDVFNSYCEDMSYENHLKLTRFKVMWNKEFPNLKIPPRNRFTKCDECEELKKQLKEAKIEDDFNALRERRQSHLQLANSARQKYYKHIKKAKQYPDNYLSIIIDSMDQNKTSLPHFSTPTKNQTSLQQMKIHLTGVLAHGQRKSYVYAWTSKYRMDVNITTNVLIDVLTDISKEKRGRLPSTLYLQLDNSAKENKNKFMIAFCTWLVKLQIFQKVKLGYLMAGHTHEDIDQMFSRFSVRLQRQDATTVTELFRCIEASYAPQPQCRLLQALWDYRTLMSTHITADMSGHSRPHNFVMRAVDNKVNLLAQLWPVPTCPKVDISVDTFVEGFPTKKLVRDVWVGVDDEANVEHNDEVRKMKNDLDKWSATLRVKEGFREWWEDFLSQETTRSRPPVEQLSKLGKFLPRTKPPSVLNEKVLSVLDKFQKKSQDPLNIKLKRKTNILRPLQETTSKR
ncbi:ATP binding [Branchiostoma belcheri]|nr:ATP binding [Branchiostoma belcheri]